MTIPFILHSLPCSSIFLWQSVNLTEGDNSLLYLLIIMSHKNLACTYFITSELRDFSLGQIAFTVFRALFAMLCHLRVLLTSTCKQAQLLCKHL